MTRKEAIKVLKRIRHGFVFVEKLKSLEMAITALQREEKREKMAEEMFAKIFELPEPQQEQ